MGWEQIEMTRGRNQANLRVMKVAGFTEWTLQNQGRARHPQRAAANIWRLYLCVLSAIALVVAAGCTKPAVPAPPVSSEPPLPTQAQGQLPTLKLWLGAEELVTEIASTLPQVQTGMMFRTNMAENAGMLFVFSVPHRAAFWMKNTSVPLSAAYISPDGTILEIHDLHPHNTNSVEATSQQMQYVLEANQGWFKRHNISTGAVIRTELGTLQKTFFPETKAP